MPDLSIQKAAKAEDLAKQAVANYLTVCNPLQPGETQQYLKKLGGVCARHIVNLDGAAAERQQKVSGALGEEENDPSLLWAEIHRLRAALAGPSGFSTWQDAATAERLMRVQTEQSLAAALAQQPAVDVPPQG